ncbi:hypothetical protein KUTeg_011884 [Tegillarca granosa]|uniref:B box-type domain-containing protein n=1 Tax=Tegillarca granosa TaxID=220873 RepID=A0ABQ9EY59_TEGGR|nr:hypothetical protein KUTeg_011884 [Tegillarca granosa]
MYFHVCTHPVAHVWQITEMVSSTALCVKKSTKIEGKTSDLFPLDPSRKHIVDCYLVHRKPENITCDQCTEGQSSATSRCKECGDFLCSACADVHQKTKLTKNHNVLTLNKLKSSSVEDFRNVQTCQVSGHEGQPFTHYCCSPNCEKPICNIQSNILDIRQLTEQTKGVADKIQIELKKLGQNEKQIANEIENVFRAHQEALEKRKLELRDNVSHTVAKKRQILETQLKSIEKEVLKLDQVCKFSDEHFSNSDASEFLQMKGSIQSRINKLTEQTTVNEPYQNGDITFDQSTNKFNYQEYARQIGFICSSSAYLPNTRVQIYDVEVGQEQVCLKITFYDYQNRPLKESGMDINAEIKEESGKITKAPIKDFTESELCYKVFVRPTHIGELTALVSVKGKPLRNTGYHIRVVKSGITAADDRKNLNRQKQRRTSYCKYFSFLIFYY